MKNETIEDTPNADDIREQTKVNRHTIFTNLISLTDTMIKEASHNGEYGVCANWSKAPRGVRDNLAEYYDERGYNVTLTFMHSYISWEKEKGDR